jgi:hypothetical protein
LSAFRSIAAKRVRHGTASQARGFLLAEFFSGTTECDRGLGLRRDVAVALTQSNGDPFRSPCFVFAAEALDGYAASVALRFGWVYGPGRKRGWRVAQEMIECFARGDRRVVVPDFSEPIDWTYVDDAVEVLLRAIAAPLPRFAAFNVVGDRRTMRDAVAHLRLRHPFAEVEIQAAALPASGWTLRNDGLEAALSYVPATRLEDGIDAMLAAYALDAAGKRGFS